MAGDDVPAYEVRRVVSAVEEADGSYVILELELKGDNAAFAFPTAQIGPLIALLIQAAGKAQAVTGNVQQQEALQIAGTEVFRDDRNLDIHFRLEGGLDLPIGMTIELAAALREQLAASLAQGSPSGAPTRQ